MTLRGKSKPKILFFGAHPRAAGIRDLYGMQNFEPFALTDRNEQLGGAIFEGIKINPLSELDLSQVELVVITEDPVDNHRAARAELSAAGVNPNIILSIEQPGAVHRALNRYMNLTPDQARNIGYRAVRQNLFHRGQYAYCMVLAAETALRMDIKCVTAIEFGVWFGSGLKNLCEIADFLNQTLGVSFKVLGFDTGVGLPGVKDYRDHPELWASGTLVMPNFQELKNSLPDFCELIIGDIADTLGPAMAKVTAEAPVGFVSIDVDQYHSTVSCLKVFDAHPDLLLPVIPVWVDDSYLSVLQTTWAGEALAIREFNDSHPLRKIEQKIIRTDDFPRLWHHCIWFGHIFDHAVRQGTRPARMDRFYHTSY